MALFCSHHGWIKVKWESNFFCPGSRHKGPTHARTLVTSLIIGGWEKSKASWTKVTIPTCSHHGYYKLTQTKNLHHLGSVSERSTCYIWFLLAKIQGWVFLEQNWPTYGKKKAKESSETLSRALFCLVFELRGHFLPKIGVPCHTCQSLIIIFSFWFQEQVPLSVG